MIMKKRSLMIGLKLLFAVLPLGIVNAQSSDSEKVVLALNESVEPEKGAETLKVSPENSTLDVVGSLEQPGKMVLYYAKDVVTLSYINNSKAPAHFYIEDYYGDVLYSANFKNELIVHSRLKMNNLPNGVYVAVFETGKDSFKKSFEINQ